MKKILLCFIVSTVIPCNSFGMLKSADPSDNKRAEQLLTFHETSQEFTSNILKHSSDFYKEHVIKPSNRNFTSVQLKKSILAEFRDLEEQEAKLGIESNCRVNRKANAPKNAAPENNVKSWETLLNDQKLLQERLLAARTALSVLAIQEIEQKYEQAKKIEEAKTAQKQH